MLMARAVEWLGDGVEAPVTWAGVQMLTGGWLDVGAETRLEVQVEAGDQDTTVTVEARLHPGASPFDLVAPVVVGSGTVARITASPTAIGHVAQVRVLQTGVTATVAHKAFAHAG